VAQKTALSVLALPGKILSFISKGAVPHNPGKITQLSPGALPGKRYTFVLKGFGPHDPGRITELTVYGVSGQIHSFVAKTPAVSVPSGRRKISAMFKKIIGG
jgi:hypothetical protein